MAKTGFRPSGQEIGGLSYIADIVDSTTTYHGFYDPKKVYDSSATLDTSVARFLISKETKDGSGSTTALKYATTNFDQAWDDRATLNYY